MKTVHIIRTVILFAFTFFLVYLLGKGATGQFVHPRFIWGLEASCGVLAILGAVQFKQIFISSHHHSPPARRDWLACVLLALPLLLFLLIPASTLDSYMAEKKESSLAAATQSSSQPTGSTACAQDDWEPEVSDQNFMATMIILYSDPGNYIDKPIEFSGFVYKQKDFPQDCFLAARYGITCCAADAQITGLLCHFNGVEPPSKDQWVKVKGTIKLHTYQNQVIPVVEIGMLQLTNPPATPYVY